MTYFCIKQSNIATKITYKHTYIYKQPKISKMKTTKLLIILLLLSFIAHLPLHAQNLIKCDNIIFPVCPGSDNDPNGLILGNRLKNTSACDTAYIIQAPMFGTVEYVGSGGSLDSLELYDYETNTNCEVDDSFLAVECCVDSIGTIVCDTVLHMIHIGFECETPDDLFCCIPHNGTLVTFDVLTNDNDFINLTYPESTVLNASITGITDGVNQVNTELVLLADNTFQYSNDTDMESIDDFSYQVFYEIETVDGDTITICDEQTCYVIVEDCLNTLPDKYCVAPGDTLCINPLDNDNVQITQNSPIFDSLGLECQTVLIDSASLMIFPEPSSPPLFAGGLCDNTFLSTTLGTYTYTYDVCTDLGACKTDTIRVKVEGCYFEELIIDGDFDDPTGSTFDSGLVEYCDCGMSSWCIGTTPRAKCNNQFWGTFGAPTDCSPNFLIIDGGSVPKELWSQDVAVNSGSTYEFSFWYYPNVSGGGTPNLEIRLGNDTFGSTTGVINTWTKYTFNVVADSTETLPLNIVQISSSGNNDFAIDHISFRELCPSWNICDSVIDLRNSPLYSDVIHAQNQIITSGNVPSGANVTLKAGQCIQLQQGFNSNANADLQIIIENCIPE